MPIVLKSGILNLLEPSGRVQACDRIALPPYHGEENGKQNDTEDFYTEFYWDDLKERGLSDEREADTRVGTLIVATIYLQLIQNTSRYMFRSFTVHQCSHQHCVQPVASDVEVVGYL